MRETLPRLSASLELTSSSLRVRSGGVMTKLARDSMPPDTHGLLNDTPELAAGFAVCAFFFSVDTFVPPHSHLMLSLHRARDAERCQLPARTLRLSQLGRQRAAAEEGRDRQEPPSVDPRRRTRAGHADHVSGAHRLRLGREQAAIALRRRMRTSPRTCAVSSVP